MSFGRKRNGKNHGFDSFIGFKQTVQGKREMFRKGGRFAAKSSDVVFKKDGLRRFGGDVGRGKG